MIKITIKRIRILVHILNMNTIISNMLLVSIIFKYHLISTVTHNDNTDRYMYR